MKNKIFDVTALASCSSILQKMEKVLREIL